MRLEALQKATVRVLLKVLKPKEETQTVTTYQPIDPASILQEMFGSQQDCVGKLSRPATR
ncbi:hypothetical protein D3C87_1571520 [compost metagenome]